MISLAAVGCSANGASSNHSQEALFRFAHGVHETEIREGSFKRLVIGSSKREVLSELRAMNVPFVKPGIRNEIAVTRSADLEKLRTASGLIVGAGDVVVAFEGDEVVRLEVAPIFPAWKTLLEQSLTRDQVFEAFRKILDEYSDVVVRNVDPEAKIVAIEHPRDADERLLEKYDRWTVVFDDHEGHWRLDLAFERDHLETISTWHSRGEVP